MYIQITMYEPYNKKKNTTYCLNVSQYFVAYIVAELILNASEWNYIKVGIFKMSLKTLFAEAPKIQIESKRKLLKLWQKPQQYSIVPALDNVKGNKVI